MAKFTAKERLTILNIVADLSIKRIPDPLIIKHIQNVTGHTVTRMTLWNVRQRIKRESYKWYIKPLEKANMNTYMNLKKE
jgi:hypothetical protein